MSLYTRARRHIDMNRVKELREEKIKREQIAKLVQEQEKIRAELEYIEAEESKYINWRKELNEGMTTVGLGMINLEPSPDVISNEMNAYDSSESEIASVSGESIQLGVPEGQPFVSNVIGNARTQLRQATFKFDSTRIDTLVINTTNGGGAPFWYDPHPRRESTIQYSIYQESDPFAVDFEGTLSDGDNVLTLPSSLRVSDLEIYIIQYASNGEFSGGYNPPSYINSISTKRLSPINLFVALDDPEANAFVRDGTVDKMSPAEKKKKLEEQLAASEEYLNKMFGSGMPKGATTIADYEPQKSFSDIKISLSPEDLRAISDRVGGSYSGPKGTEIAAAQQGPIPPGPRGYKKPGTYNPDKFYEYRPEKPASPNLPFTGPGYSKGTGDTQVARIYPPDADPGDIQWPRKKNQKVPPGPGARPSGKPIGPELPRARKKQKTMVAHHEPHGEVIKEKKSFKDITKKIPGYYDGKPSPLGFPVEEPPKTVNGYHPDLVDGKKVANRFNRLDPISARAMPKTGNPHIDKKVRAAAKKPK